MSISKIFFEQMFVEMGEKNPEDANYARNAQRYEARINKQIAGSSGSARRKLQGFKSSQEKRGLAVAAGSHTRFG